MLNQVPVLADYTFISRYAQYLPNEKRRETYKEAVNRNKNMNLVKYAGMGIEDEIETAFSAVLDGLCIGSQRNLQFAGPAILNKNARGFNCWGSYCDRPRFFQEAMWILLAGGGVGCSVQKHHIDKLPKFRTTSKTKDLVISIEDSIEGWADSIGSIINSYLNTGLEYDGTKIIFDYSNIRPEGSSFSHGVGTAPGSVPLENAHKKIITLLERCLQNNQTRLRPVDAYDIMMHCSDAVLSGGIRRSASIVIFSLDDDEMMNAKTGDWYVKNPQRGRSNNSVLLLRNLVTRKQFLDILNKTKQFGEPGFFWADSTEAICNPCLSGDTKVLTKEFGHVMITDILGKSVSVFDGTLWQTTIFYETGVDQEILRICCGDVYVDVTNNHIMILKDGTRLPACFIRPGDKLLTVRESGLGVSEIIKQPKAEKVYCCYVNSNNQFTLSNSIIVGNCLEINFYCYNTTIHGWKESPEYSGWQACNLSSNNGGKIKTKQDFMRAVEASTIIGTLQAGYTNFEYLGKNSEDITKKEALLGVSITGMMENPDILLDPIIQKEATDLMKDVNKRIAKKIGINQAARLSAIKPEGSASAMLGTSSGIHPHHSRKYIRRVQSNKNEQPVNFYKNINPHSVEESVWSANKSDYVVAFACETGKKSIIKSDLSAKQFLEYVKLTQINYVMNGKNAELCAQPWLNNNVSNTCIVKNHEWDDIGDYIFDNKEFFTGVSLLSDTGDKDYDQAPFVAVFTPEELLEKYGNAVLFTSGLIEDAFETFGNLWVACSTALGTGEDLTIKSINHYNEARINNMKRWINRLEKFAKSYLKNNIKNATYLLKDVYNYKYYIDLQNKYKPVDFEKMVEDTNNTSGSKELACGGGACLL